MTSAFFDWKTSVTLDPKLFDVNTWMPTKHWARP